MAQIDKILNHDFALFKRICWLNKPNSGVDLFFANNKGTFSLFREELEALNGVTVFNETTDASSITFDILFSDMQSHRIFNQQFYIEGSLKERFKDCMRKTKEAELAFYMASSLRQAFLLAKDSLSNDVFRHFFYEIKTDSTQKFFAQLPENKESFEYFQWMLSQPETLSITAFYDTKSQTRYLQSLFWNYSQKFEQEIIEQRKKFPNYSLKRLDHNEAQQILHRSAGAYANIDISHFAASEPEYFAHVDPSNQLLFPIRLFESHV